MYSKFWKFIRVKSVLSWEDTVAVFLAEFIGTAILLFVGCLGSTFMRSPEVEMESPLAFGMGVMLAMQAFGTISGGHVNPIMSLTAVLLGRISITDLIFYLVGQFAGAFFGFGIVTMVVTNLFMYGTENPKDDDYRFCSPRVNPDMTPMQALGVEMTISFILTMVACGMWDLRNEKYFDSRALRFGVTMAGLAIAAGPFTNACMNPARTFAAAVINDYWDYHYVYWLGQIGGGILGALVYIVFFIQLEEPDAENKEGAEEAGIA